LTVSATTKHPSLGLNRAELGFGGYHAFPRYSKQRPYDMTSKGWRERFRWGETSIEMDWRKWRRDGVGSMDIRTAS